MKKILFVINTLGRAGAETALLELLRRLDAEEYEISLYVLLGQGEMISQVPQRVHVKNKKICTASVLSGAYPKGAYVSADSPYRNFFSFNDPNAWPYNTSYDGWWAHDTLPKLNYEGSRELYDYILRVGQKWVCRRGAM